MGMVVATEELSRGSLGVGGSLITRPEILTRALVKGGTEEQKQEWLPRLATAEVMAAVAVTEPDFGSDVARHQGHGDEDRRRLADQRREDVVHVRRPGHGAHAARPHRPRPLEDPPRPVDVRGAQAGGRAATASSSTQEAGADGGAPAAGRWRAARSTRSATAGMHSYEIAFDDWFVPDANLVGRRGRPGQGLLPADGRLRERPAADRGPRHRRDAGRLRGRPPVRPRPLGVRPAHRRLPAHQGQARPHGGHHPGRPPVQLRRRPADGQGRGLDGGGHGQGLRVQGRRVGDPRGDADPRRLRLRRGVRGQPLLRRRPGAVDLRGRRRDAVPQGHRPPPASRGPRRSLRR